MMNKQDQEWTDQYVQNITDRIRMDIKYAIDDESQWEDIISQVIENIKKTNEKYKK